MTVIHTYPILKNPKRQASLFAISLAQMGYTSVIKKIATGYIIIASDDQAVEFIF